jgi:cell division septum initiation protein DivIVA
MEMKANELGDLQQAHSDLIWLGDRLKGLMGLADKLAHLGSLEKLTADAQERLDHYQRREAEIRSSLSLQAVADANADVAKLRSDSKAEAAAIVQKAHEQATELGLEARAKADKIVADARAKADEIGEKLAFVNKALAAAR